MANAPSGCIFKKLPESNSRLDHSMILNAANTAHLEQKIFLII